MDPLHDHADSTTEPFSDIHFSDIFNLDEIQRLQDLFADTHGVASLITLPDGIPITRPSNFCRLCTEIIRKTKKGLDNCFKSDAAIGRYDPSGPIMKPCLSGGLWDGGASITVGGKHIANWLIGQVRNNELDNNHILLYADEIGTNREEFIEALNEVPVMSMEQFGKVSKLLFAFANQLSEKAYTNLQLKIEIAERKKAIELLEERENKYRNIFENAQEGIFQTNVDGTYRSVNPALAKIYGFESPEELKNNRTNISEEAYSDPNERSNFLRMMDEYGFVKGYEYEVKHKDGHTMWFYEDARAIKDENGQTQYFEGFVVDITDRKQAEIDLQNSESTLKESQFIAKIGSYVLDVTSGDWKSSEVLDSIFGIDPYYKRSVEGWVTIIHPEWQQTMANYFLQDVLGKKLNFDKEYKILRQNDRTERWVHGIGRLKFNDKNEPIKMVGTIHDITERKLVEFELIKAKEKAEESDRLKSAFLANMSHEIRTPMNGILGFAEILKEPELTSEQQYEYLEIIERSGIRMLNIINDIVDISKIESGQMKISLSETNINEQLKFIEVFFKAEVEQSGLQLSVENILPSKNATIITDREKLYAILTNLVKNAIKYTKEGSIEFGVSTLQQAQGKHVSESEFVEPELKFYVKDSGIGIPENRQQAIFERFIQADIVNKMARQGAGLGLAITKAYVEMLGGRIWVESEEGKGSTFYFTLPIQVETKKMILP
jgi:PAS domain S-box-containing protein